MGRIPSAVMLNLQLLFYVLSPIWLSIFMKVLQTKKFKMPNPYQIRSGEGQRVSMLT